MLGTNLNGEPYDYDGPYFPQYRPEQFTVLHMNGRYWIKRSQLTPYTRYRDGQFTTVQGLHTTVWTVSQDGSLHVVRSSREVNAPRHPQR